MPLLSLGIPGSPSTAVLLGAFIMHGLQPGQKMLTENLPIVFSLSFAHLFGAFVACTLGLFVAKYFAKITTVPSKILVPLLSAVCLTGVFATRGRLTDVILTVFFAAVGYAMIKCNIPRVPMILGLILGPLIERSFQVFHAAFRWVAFDLPVETLFDRVSFADTHFDVLLGFHF